MLKWLTALRLINWHYFDDETLTFGRRTLITGKNATGKSTIIDALQVLFIADQRQIRFNAAAHEDAKRKMIDYLRGKVSDEDRHALRDGDFTTYIVAEFDDTDKAEPFVVGAVIDVFADEQYETEYFILAETRLQELSFLEASGALRNRESFRRAHMGFGGRRVIFERNKDEYRRQLLTRLGSLRDRFFNVFSRAIAFQPIRSVRDDQVQYHV